MKQQDNIRRGLRSILGLTVIQTEVTMRMMRLWAYYGKVYPKAATLVGEYCPTDKQVAWRAREGIGPLPRRGEIGRATFWRTIARLEEMGLIQVVNRYLWRPHAQISNLYQMEKLMVLIARYLAEKTRYVWEDWLSPYLHLSWPQFWVRLNEGLSPPGGRAGGESTAEA